MVKSSNTVILSYIWRKKCSYADGMIADFQNKLRHISDQIHHPFTAGPLLANPLQEINITDLVK